jgi:hypothetical protein
VNNINVNKGNRPANKASQSDSLRKQQYKKTLDNQHHVSMDEFLNGSDPELDIKGYIQHLFNQQKLKETIREEIEKLLYNT